MSCRRMCRGKKRTSIERVRFYPGFLAGNEEKFLEKMASRGWRLAGVSGETVYCFDRAEASGDIYAVEFLGKRQNDPAEIAEDCNAGWDYVGTFGRKRYYRCLSDRRAVSHPSADSDAEQLRLSSTMTNLTTVLLLNIPGTLYCMLYTVLLLMTGGLSMISLFSYQVIYILGTILGILSIYILAKWILAARRRGKHINSSGGEA
ncbi:MAG: DUF2812 domain-containing protein [Clostridiales bacterium]|nr:DUF2812 domain-containing protein [Clostridiales bacterium]